MASLEVQDWRDVDIIIGGHRVEGLSDDDNPVEVADVTHIEEKYGHDGKMYAMATGRKGTQVTLRVFPNSNTAMQCASWHAQMTGGNYIELDGSIINHGAGTSLSLRGGFLKTSRPISTPGNTTEATFVFEEATPSVGGASYRPPPGADI